MSGALEFSLQLSGNMAGALEAVSTNLGKTEGNAKKAKDGIHLFESEVGKASASLGGFSFNLAALAKGGSLFTFDLAEGARMAFEVFEKLGEKIVDIGKDIIKTAAKTEDLNLALKLNLGTKGAEEFNELAESFEKTTRFDASQMKEAWLPLLDVGMKDKGLIDDLSTAAVDIAARTNGGTAKLQEVLGSFRQMFLRDQISKGTFTSLGIEQSGFYGALAKAHGTSAAEAEKMAKGHKISSSELLQTALNQIAAREGGTLGGGALAGAKTLGGTLARLGNLSDNLFEKLAGSPGMRAVQGLLDDFIGLMKGEAGDKIVKSIGSAFESVGATIQKVKIAAEEFWPVIKLAGEMFAFFEGVALATSVVEGAVALATTVLTAETWSLNAAFMANPIGIVIGAVALLGIAAYELIEHWDGVKQFFVDLWHTVADFGLKMWEGAKEIGVNIWQGLRDGILGGLDAIKNAAAALGDTVVGGLKNLLGIHSPSTVFAEMGGYSAEGFAIGMEGGAGRVESAARRSIVDTAMGGDSSASPGGFGGASIVFSPTINMTAGGGNAEQIADQTAQSIRVEFVKVLAEAGIAFGAG